ncbi:MAG: anthranilate phosphoribosyltransferase, partial [Chloroflexi bacterium]|nr:anthranilate phosphoribosyltransferase [Chloroflexota bacterium]
MDLKQALAAVVGGGTLSRADARATMGVVMAGEATPAQIGALIACLAARGETVDEIAGFAEAMRDAMVKVAVPDGAIDVVGTGGSRVDPFNISTTAAIVAAAAGARVAKHGNRAVTGRCGAADVLEALGVKIDLPADRSAACLAEAGITFFLAPNHHPAMRHAGPVRREIGVRTVFNILGPLANPAGVRRLVLGVATPAVGERLAQVLAQLGVDHALVVHGEEGLDDISPCGPTGVWELRGGSRRSATFDPAAFGLVAGTPADIASGDAQANASTARAILGGEPG